MARPKSVQITIRIPSEWTAEAEALADAMSQPGIPITATDVWRAAIARGLVELRRPSRSRSGT